MSTCRDRSATRRSRSRSQDGRTSLAADALAAAANASRTAGAANRARSRAARSGVRGDRRLGRAHRRSRPHPRAFACRARSSSSRRFRIRARSRRSSRRRAPRSRSTACLPAATTTSCCSRRRRRSRRASRQSRAELALPLTRIGSITVDCAGLSSTTSTAGRCPTLPRAYDHFASERMKRKPPTLQFLLSHPAHFIALGFGAGLAPGRAGNLRHAGRDSDRDGAARLRAATACSCRPSSLSC